MRCGEIAQTFIHIMFSKFTKHNLSLCNYCIKDVYELKFSVVSDKGQA